MGHGPDREARYRQSQISIDDLLAAKSVSGAFGGTDKAIAALQVLKQLEG